MTNRIGKPNTPTDAALEKHLITSAHRHFVMVAGAGSGKTTSLVKALAYIESLHGPKFRVKGQQIACITFTEVAVSEIHRDIGGGALYHVSTIHSFLWKVVKPFQSDLRNWVRTHLQGKIKTNLETIDKPGTSSKKAIELTAENQGYTDQLSVLGEVTTFRYGTGSDYVNGILGHSDIEKVGATFIRDHATMRYLVSHRYPVIFVDESQDTYPDFVDALIAVAKEYPREFCVGFFGDPMQQIYPQAKKQNSIPSGWKVFKKPENFRCSQSVLRTINKIRTEKIGEFEQSGGLREIIKEKSIPIAGTARVLIMPDDDLRTERLQKARQWLAKQDSDNAWLEDENDGALRMLVLVHRLAANRLRFPNLYSALNDKAPEELKSGVVDGTAWVLRPLLLFLLPLLTAHCDEQSFKMMRILRKQCPMLQDEALKGCNPATVLLKLKEHIVTLERMLQKDAGNTIGDALTFLRDHKLFEFDKRYFGLFAEYRDEDKVDEPMKENAALRFMQCPAFELWGYRRYIEKQSPFATQHGIKGAEFNKVLVEVDDKTGTYRQYSYKKYFEYVPLSITAQSGQQADEPSIISRTRRLFYVCCSRARTGLVVAIFCDDTERMKKTIIKRDFFKRSDVHVLK